MEGGENDMEVESRVGGGGKSTEKTILMWGFLPGTAEEEWQMFRPDAVRLPESAAGERWLEIGSGGLGFAMAVTESGKLYTWGATEDVGLQNYLASGKHETPEVYSLPTKRPITMAAAGWANCCAVTDIGSVYAWGWKECAPREKNKLSEVQIEMIQDSKAGDCPRHSRSKSWPIEGPEEDKYDEETVMLPPTLVSLPIGVRITTVASGGRHTLALSDGGLVYGWGYGGDGQLGLGSRTETQNYPRRIHLYSQAAVTGYKLSSSKRAKTSMESRVTAIACGGRHSAVLTDKGEIFTFGRGRNGQCGHGNREDHLYPTLVSALMNIKIQAIATGFSHTVSADVDGRIFVFGSNRYIQLGIEVPSTEFPQLLNISWKAKIVSCGSDHTAIITDEGEVVCWGWNKYGQLGIEEEGGGCYEPTKVELGNYRPLNISCGWWHTLVIAEHPENGR